MGGGGSSTPKPIYKVQEPTLNNPPTVAMDAVAARNAARAGEAEAVGDKPQSSLNTAAVRAADDPSRSRYRERRHQSAAGAMQGLKSSAILTG